MYSCWMLTDLDTRLYDVSDISHFRWLLWYSTNKWCDNDFMANIAFFSVSKDARWHANTSNLMLYGLIIISVALSFNFTVVWKLTFHQYLR